MLPPDPRCSLFFIVSYTRFLDTQRARICSLKTSSRRRIDVSLLVTASAEIAGQGLLAAIEACGLFPVRHLETVYGAVAHVDVQDGQANSLAGLVSDLSVSVIPAESRSGKELQELFKTVAGKHAWDLH